MVNSRLTLFSRCSRQNIPPLFNWKLVNSCGTPGSDPCPRRLFRKLLKYRQFIIQHNNRLYKSKSTCPKSTMTETCYCTASTIVAFGFRIISAFRMVILNSSTTQFYTSAITSTSHNTFLGSVFTATQERAGLPVKYFA